MPITDHPNYNNLFALIQSLVSIIKQRQAIYFIKCKQYFQGLRIPISGKLDGITDVEISTTVRPSDQSATWMDFAPVDFKGGQQLPVHISITVYTSPIGYGWILTIEFWKKLGPDNYGNVGDHWIWQHNEGPETRTGIWDDWFVQSDDEMV